MSSERPSAPLSDDVLLLLNRATVVVHAVRTAAHELNNVLQTIAGSAELMDGDPALSATLKRRVDAILRQTSRGHGLVATVADLARAESPAPRPVDLARAVEEAIALRSFEHNRSGTDVAAGPPPDRPALVRAAPRDLQVMLLNLLINAEQAVAGRPGAAIRLTVSASGAHHQVTISSNAPAPAGDGVFEPLASTRPPQVGAGLGLSATRLLARRYGGQVELVARGDATDAVLTLPAAASS
jgi:two-component system C4-dicarboxylate transport sensor histidine kinase DctB